MPDSNTPEDMRRLTGLITLGIIVNMLTFVAIVVAICLSLFGKLGS